MADILRSYEQQFGIICADIMSNISRASSTPDKSSAITLIDNLFQEASEIIEQMDLEIRDINSAIKRTPEEKEKYTNIIKSYKKELSKLETEFNKQVKSQKVNKSISSNFEIQLNDDEDEELNDLRRENQASMQSASGNLERGYKIVLETEETGNNILRDLFGQREQITRSRDRMREANSNLGKSSRIVGDMARRLIQNKLILIGMCFLLFLFLIFIIYYVVKK
jgi:vesicle transport through interaction with t-SNAREs protein 1